MNESTGVNLSSCVTCTEFSSEAVILHNILAVRSFKIFASRAVDYWQLMEADLV